MLFGLSFTVEAQPTKILRIGFVVGTGPEGPNISLFRQEMRDLGYIEVVRCGANKVAKYDG